MDDRPRVTVRDPSRPGGAPDLLSSGDEDRPRVSSRARRRLLAAAAVLAVVGAGAVELRDRRDERRLASVVDLELVGATAPGGGSSSDGRTVSLELSVQLRNAGPRAVTVLSGGVADYGVVRPVELPAGRTSTVLLERRVQCGATPPPDDPATGTLALSVRAGTVARRVALPVGLPADAGSPAVACGFRRVEQGVVLSVPETSPQAQGVTLALDLRTSTPDAVSVLGARADDGFDVSLRETDGTPLRLPRPLPVPRVGSTVGVLLEALVTVGDCGAARRVRTPVLRMSLSDDRGRVVEVSSRYDPGVVRSLVDRSC